MNRALKTLLLSAALATSVSASAALFDTIDSVEPLQKIAAKKHATDRMPAGKITEPKDDANTETEKSDVPAKVSAPATAR